MGTAQKEKRCGGCCYFCGEEGHRVLDILVPWCPCFCHPARRLHRLGEGIQWLSERVAELASSSRDD